MRLRGFTLASVKLRAASHNNTGSNIDDTEPIRHISDNLIPGTRGPVTLQMFTM
jgi:hypothetical protein